MAAISFHRSSSLIGVHLFLVGLVIYDQVLCTVLYTNCSAYVIEDMNAPLFICHIIKDFSLSHVV